MRQNPAITLLAVGLMVCLTAALLGVGAEPLIAKGPPASSGPIVVRTETIFAVFYVDLRRGVSAIHGANIVDFCNGIIEFDLVELLEIDVPEDANRLIDIIHADEITTSVWPFTVFDCNLFTTVTPLATGTADLISTDNDLLVFLTEDNINWNAFGFVAHGFLEDAGGNVLVFNGHERCIWDGNDGETFMCSDVINLR